MPYSYQQLAFARDLEELAGEIKCDCCNIPFPVNQMIEDFEGWFCPECFENCVKKEREEKTCPDQVAA